MYKITICFEGDQALITIFAIYDCHPSQSIFLQGLGILLDGMFGTAAGSTISP